MPAWIPKEDLLRQRIEEEKIRAETLRQKEHERWQPRVATVPEPTMTVETPTQTLEQPTLEPTIAQEPEPASLFPAEPIIPERTWQPRLAPELGTVIPQTGTLLAEPITPVVPTIPQEVAWYEQPKQLFGKAEEAVAKQISKVPLLPKALEKVAPIFEWVSKNLEKPFAATILSAFSPSLSWRQGESWLEHQKREYEEWQAPTYVKGLAEFAMPLWWLPWLGWAGKGAKALGTGKKIAEVAAKTAQTTGKLGQVTLPTSQVLDSSFKLNFTKKLALWAENKKVFHQIVKAIGGEAAFTRMPEVGETALHTTRRALAKRFTIFDMRKGMAAQLMPKVLKHGNIEKKLQMDKMGRVLGATPIDDEGIKLGRGISEVIEHPSHYKFATAEAKQIVDDTRDILTEVFRVARFEGIELPENIFYHRILKGKTVLDAKMKPHFEESEFGSLFEKARTYETMELAIAENAKKFMTLQYGTSIRESLESTINYYIKRIANKRFEDEIGQLGKTAMERFALAEPELAEKIIANAAKITASKYALAAVTKLKSYKGASIPGATLEKIRSALPDIANQIDLMFDLPRNDVLKILSGMTADIRKAIKLSPKEFRIIASQYEGRTLIEKIANAIMAKSKDNVLATKMIEKIYKNAYKLNKTRIDDAVVKIQDQTRNLIKSTVAENKPLKAQRAAFLKHFRGHEVLAEPTRGEHLAKFRRHPAFQDKFFDDDVVKFVEKIEGDKGQAWLKAAAGLSGASRMFVATLDFSAPFIQGLNVLGRNPVAWTTGVARQFEFFLNPVSFYKYMDDPVIKSIVAERVTAGASISSFEFFDILKPLQRLAGGKLAPVIQQTFGRAEAVFTGYGEVVRNEMWKALRRPNMTPEQLRELARLIDRMTGVMSTEAIGIGRTQQDFENAFVFFAPRYTRASLSFVGDVFRGGMTGAEARKSLGSLMASGFAMYYGTSKALGQQPNLNPKSGRFLTIKVGDQYIGIGGIMYSMMRFAYNVTATASGDEPLDLIRLNRFDNPLIKFLYGRTAPLTGALTNVIENKNYLGEPIESIGDWGRFMMEKVTPIALQTTIETVTEEGKFEPLVFLAEEAGGRTFPQSAWEYREQARDKHAIEDYGKPYGDLPVLYQKEIDKAPDVQMFSQEAEERQAIRGGLSAKFVQWRDERDSARQMYIDKLTQLQRAYDDGMIDGYTFKEEMQNAGYGLGVTYKHINSQKEYADVIKKLEEPKDISSKVRGDIAYDELISASFSDQFLDTYGMFQFDEYNKFREALQQKYADVWDYVLARETQTRSDLPPLAQEYYQAREILKPYWAVKDTVVKMFGQRFAESSRGQALISKRHKQMRQSNPAVERAYQTFYVRET